MTDPITKRSPSRSSIARKHVKAAAKPVIGAIAVIYFLVDALFLVFIRPLASRLAQLRIFKPIANWIRSLPPYPTLLLFVVPIVILEPVKPVGAYLMASGHFVQGVLLITIGEILKITIVERLFHANRHKLLTIGWFACIYNYVMAWITWLKALPPWQAVSQRLARIKEVAKRLWVRLGAVAHSAPSRVTETRSDGGPSQDG